MTTLSQCRYWLVYAVQLLITAGASLATEESDTPRSPEISLEGIVALAPGIEPPGEQSSATEKFLYGLAAATESYFLDAAYKPGYGNDVLTDALWALHRATKVKELMESPLGAQIPGVLRDFCNEALVLDAMLQATSRASENAIRSGKADARDFFIDSVKALPKEFSGQESGNTMEQRALAPLFKAILRARSVEEMFNAVVRQKKEGDFHRKWDALLGRLAAEEPAIRAYAQDPRVTDPTWHFMRSSVLGDVFFGQSYSSRARVHYAINRMSHRKANGGNLADGPIEINVSGQGVFVYDISVSAQSGERGPIIAGTCSRGHYALRAGDETTWVARGLSDTPRQGRIDLSKNPYWRGGKVSITLMHLATTGKSEDSEAIGSFVVYTRGQASSEEEARRIARRVKL